MQRHPALYVIGNRYVYGFRLVGGVAAGMSGIAAPKFVVLNAISALVWTMLFGGIGYVFGLGAEQIIGNTLHKHQRLLIGLGIGVVVGLCRLVRRAPDFSRRAARARWQHDRGTLPVAAMVDLVTGCRIDSSDGNDMAFDRRAVASRRPSNSHPGACCRSCSSASSRPRMPYIPVRIVLCAAGDRAGVRDCLRRRCIMPR